MRQPNLDEYLSTPTLPEQRIRALLRRRTAPTIFDIGACEGEDSVRYAKAFPHGRVYAFEPLPQNQILVRTNFSKYQIANAELVPLALSNQAGPATFHVSFGEPDHKFAGEDWNYGNKSSSLLPPASAAPMHGWIRFPETIAVECSTVDDFCAARHISEIDFIHMDVQGAEWLVLQGAHRMLSQVRSVWLEVADAELYAGQKLRTDIEALMATTGFALLDQDRRGTEGDQFYVNLREWNGRAYTTRWRLHRAWGRARQQFGALRRRWSSSP